MCICSLLEFEMKCSHLQDFGLFRPSHTYGPFALASEPFLDLLLNSGASICVFSSCWSTALRKRTWVQIDFDCYICGNSTEIIVLVGDQGKEEWPLSLCPATEPALLVYSLASFSKEFLLTVCLIFTACFYKSLSILAWLWRTANSSSWDIHCWWNTYVVTILWPPLWLLPFVHYL